MTEKRVGRRGWSAVEWPTIVLIIGCYGAWAVAGLVVWPAYPVVALALLGLTVALQSSIVHEVLHGHPTRNALVNEAFVFLPIGLVWPYPALQGAASQAPCRRAADRSVRRSGKLLPGAVAA